MNTSFPGLSCFIFCFIKNISQIYAPYLLIVDKPKKYTSFNILVLILFNMN